MRVFLFLFAGLHALPVHAIAAPRISSCAAETGGYWRIECQTEAGQAYAVEFSTGLEASNRWSRVDYFTARAADTSRTLSLGSSRVGLIRLVAIGSEPVVGEDLSFDQSRAVAASTAPSNTPFVVTQVADSGPGSLRQVLIDANAQAGLDQVQAAPGLGSIRPSSELPAITDPLIVEGLVLDGSLAGPRADGLRVSADDCVLRGLVIQHFSGDALEITGSGNELDACMIGTTTNGMAAAGNLLYGVRITGADNLLRACVVSGNRDGILVHGAGAFGNRLEGNRIGTDATGAAALGNTDFGLVIHQASSNRVGGLVMGTGNLISANGRSGISLSMADGNELFGNFLGIAADGITRLANGEHGIQLHASSRNTVGGQTVPTGNVISGNGHSGLLIENGSDDNLIEGNRMGLAANASVAVGNDRFGIMIRHATGNLIGGSFFRSANLVGGNGDSGVLLDTGGSINALQGNLVGTDFSGAGLGHPRFGIWMRRCSRNSCEANTIAFSGEDGVYIASGTRHALRGNHYVENRLLPVDLGPNGMTANDPLDADDGANRLQNSPDLFDAISLGGATTIRGAVEGAPGSVLDLDFLLEPAGQYLGSHQVLLPESGRADFIRVFPGRQLAGFAMAALATDAEGNSSEFGLAVPVSLEDSITFGPVTDQGLTLGLPWAPEVNINRLRAGPRGWVFGSTEEQGYLFIFDPVTGARVSWNAGRQQSGDPRLRPFDGDISDFAVWEEGGQLILIAAQAHPAEIYRYVIPLPANGLPVVDPSMATVVYANVNWKRVMSVERGEDLLGNPMLLAGGNGTAELLRSVDGGLTWQALSYFDGANELDALRHVAARSVNANIIRIAWVAEQDRWFLLLRNAFELAGEAGQPGTLHYVNGLLHSSDGGQSWQVARADMNPRLDPVLAAAVTGERAAARLHTELYAFTGEAPRSLTRLDSGRLVLSTSISNTPDEGFGGRFLVSDDGGLNWSEQYYFPGYADLDLLALPGGGLLAGTAIKSRTPPGGASHGDAWFSRDGGASFARARRIITSTEASAVRRNFFVAGVAAMTVLDGTILIGTVNEGSFAQVFSLPFSP